MNIIQTLAAKLPFFITAATLTAGAAQAGVVPSGALITDAQADQLETWLGTGDLDFTAIWTGTAGVSTAASFNSAAVGKGPTFSVFDVTLGDGSNALIGGYTSLSWGSSFGYNDDPTAFLFNLTSGELQTKQEETGKSVLMALDHFPTFGGQLDLFAGIGILGQGNGKIDPYYSGYSFSSTYDNLQGQIAVAGDTGFGNGNSGVLSTAWSVKTLEVYTFAPAALPPVPLPAGLPLLAGALGLLGFMSQRRRKG